MNNDQATISLLVDSVKSGDQASFSALYDLYSDALYGLALKILGSEEEAQDILQDSFVKIWTKIRLYEETKGTIFTWMLNIVRNASIDRLRKLKRNSSGEIQNQFGDVYSAEGIENTVGEDLIGVKEKVKGLSEEYSVLVDYLYYKGYTQQEVADEINIPLGTVKTRIKKALEDLRKVLVSILLFWI